MPQGRLPQPYVPLVAAWERAFCGFCTSFRSGPSFEASGRGVPWRLLVEAATGRAAAGSQGEWENAASVSCTSRTASGRGRWRAKFARWRSVHSSPTRTPATCPGACLRRPPPRRDTRRSGSTCTRPREPSSPRGVRRAKSAGTCCCTPDGTVSVRIGRMGGGSSTALDARRNFFNVLCITK